MSGTRCTASVGRKQREGDDADTTISIIREATTWINYLLNERQDEETARRERITSTSSLTEQSLCFLVEKYQQAADGGPVPWEELGRDITLDKKYHEAQGNLEGLVRDAWYLRYGGYHAVHLEALRGVKARNVSIRAMAAAAAARMKAYRDAKIFGKRVVRNGGDKTAGAPPIPIDEEKALDQFLSMTWVEFDEDLTREEKLSEDRKWNPANTTFTDSLWKLTTLINNHTFRKTRHCMKFYAQWNEIADIGELARTKQWLKLTGFVKTWPTSNPRRSRARFPRNKRQQREQQFGTGSICTLKSSNSMKTRYLSRSLRSGLWMTKVWLFELLRLLELALKEAPKDAPQRRFSNRGCIF